MTSGTSERPYLSIGEVLGLLLEEFPDVTISKIRFLESQGLIEPERTSSGYRKFYDSDVERLKVILREQRENFLPLRVIRDRLESKTLDDSAGAGRPAPAGDAPAAPRGIRNLHLPPPSGAAVDPTPIRTERHPAAQSRTAAPPAPPAPPAVAPTPPPAPASSGAASLRGEVFSRADLCSLGGIEPTALEQLESFGIIAGRGSGESTTFTDTDVDIVRAAAGFLARGIDARHLRAWRQSAEREAGLFEQRILPLLRQRNPQARKDATALLNDLAGLGADLRAAIVAASLRHHLEP